MRGIMSLGSFQSLVNQKFQLSLHKYILVLFYDTLIFSKGATTHEVHMVKVFTDLAENQLHINFDKY